MPLTIMMGPAGPPISLCITLSDLDENINTDLKEAVGIEELPDSEDEWTLSKYYRSKD